LPYDALVDAAPDAILAVDPDGRIVLGNAQAVRLFGYSRDELLGANVDMLVPPSVRSRHAAHRGTYAADPRPRPMGAKLELAARRKDGTEFPAEISLSAIDTPSGILVSAAVRDVTDRRRAEAERTRLAAEAEHERRAVREEQAQRLESLGQLAGGVAHDFNNMLAVILNYAEFVADKIGAAAAEPGGEEWREVAADVAQITLAAEGAARLTKQLLAFGRREVVRPQVVDLNTVVHDVEQLLRRSIGEHLRLSTTLDPALSPITADLGHLEQVLVNLAVNARDAMPDGGTLSIDTANVVVGPEYAATRPGVAVGPHVRLRVSDTGAGMTPEVVTRAFEPFYSTKPTDQGTGLGLATVYGIVTQSGGTAHIYSEPGLGTTFTALFPAVEAPVAPAANETHPPPDGRESVLLVEDEDAIREVAKRVLERAGYRVAAYANGTLALADLAGLVARDVDLLLTDVVMPGMVGTELAERVHEAKPDVRVLFMSGYAQGVLATQGRLAPDVALLEKPFSAQQLLTAVRDALGG
jgi:PAS domain S-box-containing protein